MTVWEALVLGIVQGATEFLPVSSSGHLVIGQALLGLHVPGIRFEVAVHVATLVSVVLVYRRRILSLATGAALRQEREDLRYLGLILVATIPTTVIAVLFGDTVNSLFDRPQVVGFALLLTGAFLFSTRWALGRASAPHFGAKAAFVIGLAQALALVPGISRSGATVTAALWLGVAPVEAAAFSFLMSIPAIAGAGLLQLAHLAEGTDGLSGGSVAVGSIAATVAGVLAIQVFVEMLKRRSFPAFAWYCWGAGALFLGWLALP